jgi:hypothetical protein
MPKKKTKRAVAGISLAQKLADIDARTKSIETLLSRSVARLPDGCTLINVVANIERLVRKL